MMKPHFSYVKNFSQTSLTHHRRELMGYGKNFVVEFLLLRNIIFMTLGKDYIIVDITKTSSRHIIIYNINMIRPQLSKTQRQTI